MTDIQTAHFDAGKYRADVSPGEKPEEYSVHFTISCAPEHWPEIAIKNLSRLKEADIKRLSALQKEQENEIYGAKAFATIVIEDRLRKTRSFKGMEMHGQDTVFTYGVFADNGKSMSEVAREEVKRLQEEVAKKSRLMMSGRSA